MLELKVIVVVKASIVPIAVTAKHLVPKDLACLGLYRLRLTRLSTHHVRYF